MIYQFGVTAMDDPRYLSLASYPIKVSSPLEQAQEEDLTATLEPTECGLRLILRTGPKGRYVQ